MDSRKSSTIAAYDRDPNAFAQRFAARHPGKRETEIPNGFVAGLPQEGSVWILDLGSGSGEHAAYLQECLPHATVICADLSWGMLGLSRAKGLPCVRLDFEQPLPFPDASLDGVWAYASLLHAPRRLLPIIYAELARVLKPGGMLALCFKEGSGEETERSPSGEERFFVYYDESVTCPLLGCFTTLIFERDPVQSKSSTRWTGFLEYLLRRKPEGR